jgi:hypothetical protein
MNIEAIIIKTGIADVFVQYIKGNDEFKNEFIKFAPSIESDIISLSINENCSCKDVVKRHIDINEKECLEFFTRFFEKNKDINFFNEIIEKIKSEQECKYLGGRVAKTSISDWKEFSAKISSSGSEFRSFSVVKENDDIYVFFL